MLRGRGAVYSFGRFSKLRRGRRGGGDVFSPFDRERGRKTVSFVSPAYLLFLPAVTALYWLCRKKWRPYLLLAASVGFYMGWSVPFALLLLAETALCHFSCLLIEKRKSRVLFSLLLCLAFAPLVFFKYAGFLFGWTGEGVRQWLGRIALPAGISFYTFQAASCLIDVYRGNRRAERSLARFALFVSFFPQLVAGPIERADDLMPQLTGDSQFSREDFLAGVRLLLCGYFRKICAADFLAPFVDRLFSLKSPDGFAAVLGAALFGWQIYNDFAGYSEIALGSARLLGIRLTRNFREPYLARGPRDFWRRWHITLNRWFRSYVYVPLGGRKRRFLAAGAVFLLSGLWHGASAAFICWGAYHGLLYGLETAAGKRAEKVSPWLSVPLTWLAVTLGWIFFRAADLERAFRLFGSLLTAWHPAEVWREAGMNVSVLLYLAAVLAAAFLTGRWAFSEKKALSERDLAVCALLTVAIGLCWLANLQGGTANAFIYFQF